MFAAATYCIGKTMECKQVTGKLKNDVIMEDVR